MFRVICEPSFLMRRSVVDPGRFPAMTNWLASAVSLMSMIPATPSE